MACKKSGSKKTSAKKVAPKKSTGNKYGCGGKKC